MKLWIANTSLLDQFASNIMMIGFGKVPRTYRPLEFRGPIYYGIDRLPSDDDPRESPSGLQFSYLHERSLLLFSETLMKSRATNPKPIRSDSFYSYRLLKLVPEFVVGLLELMGSPITLPLPLFFESFR